MLPTIKNSCDLETLPIGASTVMGGCAAAAYMGNFEPFTATLCMIFVLLLQIFGNLLYRYSLSRTGWGDGVERYLSVQASKNQSHKLPEILMAGVTAFGILTGMVGLALLGMAQNGTWVVALGVLIGAYIYFNTFGPRPLVRTPVSLLTTFLMFGPVGVISTTYIQASYKALDPVNWHDLMPAIMASVVTGLYAIEPQLGYNICSYKYDLHHGKTTLVTMIGPKWSCGVLMLCGIVSAVLVTLNAVFSPHEYVWIPICIFWIAAVVNTMGAVMIYRLRESNKIAYWSKINWICLIAMTLYFIYTYIWGNPDHRYLEIF